MTPLYVRSVGQILGMVTATIARLAVTALHGDRRRSTS